MISLVFILLFHNSGLGQGADSASNSAGLERLEVPEVLVIAVRDVPPFSMRNSDGQWTGISVDLLRELTTELESESGHEIELRFRDLSLVEMLDEVERGEVDLAAAAITLNYDREKRMDFTHSFHASGLGIAVAASPRGSGWSGIIDAIFSRNIRATGGTPVTQSFCPFCSSGRITPSHCQAIVR